MNIGIEKIGDWDTAMSLGDRIKKIIPPAMVEAMNSEMEGLKKAMEEVIRTGRAEGPGLAAETISRKGHSKKLVDSGDLGSALILEEVTLKGDGFVGVGKSPVPGSSLTYDKLAMIQENGNAHIPARPFLGPTIDREVPKIADRLEDKFQDAIDELA